MRTLLLDGDIIAYQMAVVAEKPIHWGEDLWTLHADADQATVNCDNKIASLLDKLDGDHVVVCLSDTKNFRKMIDPSYKANRTDVRKPMILGSIKEYLTQNYTTYVRPNLEADDVLGILATHPTIIKGEKVVVSIDKDLKTIPGLHASMKHTEDGVFSVSLEDADRWHLYQTLVGDTTDGYPGCPGVGPKKAEKLLEGDNATWATVVEAFDKAGLSELVALTQARLARILRHTDYDFKKKEPILWQPAS